MKWLSALFWGSLVGSVFMLLLYVLVLFGLWTQTRGTPDAVTESIVGGQSDLIRRTVLKFLLLNVLAGGALGGASAMAAQLVLTLRRPGKETTLLKRLFGYLAACLIVFGYANARCMVAKPVFYDALLNARGGWCRWFQNALTDRFSPVGVDLAFGLFLLAVILTSIRRMRARPAAVAAGVAAAALFLWLGFTGAPGRDLPGPIPSNGPARTGVPLNVLLLGSDSLRPDHLSCYGYPRPTSPRIDALAGRGVRFDQTYVPLARTLPSVASLFTSTYPHEHGFRHMFPDRERRRIRLPLLPEILSRAGYISAVISDYAGECYDMVDMGFDIREVPPAASISIVIEREFMQRQPYLVPFLANRAGCRLLPLLDFMMINPDPYRMTDKVIRTMRTIRGSGRPFFINAFFSCTHIPYSPPYPYYGKFTDPGYRGIHKYGFGVRDPRRLDEAMKRPPEEDRRQIVDLYDGGVAAFDDAVGRILDELERLGTADNTLIVIYSDHGENLYDNGNLLEHGERFGGGDAANRIPLIYVDPARRDDPLCVSVPVSSLDLMPTLLGRLDLPAPRSVRGRDLAPLMEGREIEPRPLFAETGLWLEGTPETYKGSEMEYPSILRSLIADPRDGTLVLDAGLERRVVMAKQRQVRTDRFKLIYIPVPAPEGARFLLYDHLADPGNERNLIGFDEYAETAGKLKRLLVEWMLEEPGSGLDGDLHLIRRFNFFE